METSSSFPSPDVKERVRQLCKEKVVRANTNAAFTDQCLDVNRVTVNIANNQPGRLLTEPFLCRDDQEPTFDLEATSHSEVRTLLLARHSELRTNGLKSLLNCI